MSDAFRAIGKMLGLAAAAATTSYDLSHKLPSAVTAYEKGILAGELSHHTLALFHLSAAESAVYLRVTSPVCVR